MEIHKLEALRIITEIKENVHTCCALIMEPDKVLDLLNKLEEYITSISVD